jgi:hypothetical protein
MGTEPGNLEIYGSMDVCVDCIGEDELQAWIRDNGDIRECGFCRATHEAVPLEDLGEFIVDRWREFYYLAQNAPVVYSSADGGYQAPTFDTYDLLYDTHPIDLPNDQGDVLRDALLNACGEEQWIDPDLWGTANEDRFVDWADFSKTVKHRRRFFFHSMKRSESGEWGEWGIPFSKFLKGLAALCLDETLGLVRGFSPANLTLYRSRRRKTFGEIYETAKDLGPPLAVLSKQSNRMNPPGIPMFYGADTSELAIAETGAQYQSVGQFTSERRLIILDLASLPKRKGIYSGASRWEVNAISFLHDFADIIRAPVTRDQGEHIEYVPTQVFTELLRDFPFLDGMPLDGVRYRSATGVSGANIVLFATQNDVIDGSIDSSEDENVRSLAPDTPKQTRWLRLVNVEQISTITIKVP